MQGKTMSHLSQENSDAAAAEKVFIFMMTSTIYPLTTFTRRVLTLITRYPTGLHNKPGSRLYVFASPQWTQRSCKWSGAG